MLPCNNFLVSCLFSILININEGMKYQCSPITKQNQTILPGSCWHNATAKRCGTQLLTVTSYFLLQKYLYFLYVVFLFLHVNSVFISKHYFDFILYCPLIVVFYICFCQINMSFCLDQKNIFECIFSENCQRIIQNKNFKYEFLSKIK